MAGEYEKAITIREAIVAVNNRVFISKTVLLDASEAYFDEDVVEEVLA